MKMRLRTAVTVTAALGLGALVVPPAHAATQRFAVPAGTGTACSAAAPCSLETAVNGAADDDEVIVAPGTYTTASSLARNVRGLNIHGVPGQPRPVINSSASRAIDIGQSGVGTRITDLTIVHTGGGYGLNVFAKSTRVQRVEVRSAGAVACSPGISGVMLDSLCVTSAAGGIALDDSWNGDVGQLDLRNVTAIATGPASYGIRADAGSNSLLRIDAVNVIASGAAADVRATESGSNNSSVVTMRNSNFDTREEAGGGAVSASTTNANQTAPPIYLETVTYRQAPGSPTIDKGATYTGIGGADLDGNPRVAGSAPDIGADELDVVPPDTVLIGPTKKKLRKLKLKFTFAASEPATFVCKVDKKKAKPCTSPLKRKFKRYGKHKLTITAVDAVGNVDPTPLVHVFKIKRKKRTKP